MARGSPQSHAKRLREQLKKDRRRVKDEKRSARKEALQCSADDGPTDPRSLPYCTGAQRLSVTTVVWFS
jgi:hypothetical protein